MLVPPPMMLVTAVRLVKALLAAGVKLLIRLAVSRPPNVAVPLTATKS